ncbi:MAG: hypothetical protein Q9227_005210 [Pyrenula ochraceoflavens]
MAGALTGTIIITGANGTLGSRIAIIIARHHPLVHLLLAVRSVAATSVYSLSEKLRTVGPRSFEIVGCDMGDFDSVKAFARHTVERIKAKEIPSVRVLVNSAQTLSFARDAPTDNGFDPVYQTNCLAPFLLTVTLLEGFRAGKGPHQTRVINIGAPGVSIGRLDYFSKQAGTHSAITGVPRPVKEGLCQYASSKLIFSVAMYALRRSLLVHGGIHLDMFTVDPGGISNRTQFSTSMPTILRATQTILSSLRPLIRPFSRRMMNDADVPARAVEKVAFGKSASDSAMKETYYILDDEYELVRILDVSKDEEKMQRVFQQVMRDVGLDDGPT